jgi:ClpP class serine protease
MSSTARKKIKKVYALAHYAAVAEAYVIASAADAISATPSAAIGGIGTAALHIEESEKLAKAGLAVTLISAPPSKTEGNPFEPLTSAARGAMQHRIDEVYGRFVATIARGRNVTQPVVRDGFGRGRVLGAADALKAGMIDRVETMDQMVARLARAGASSGRMPMLGASSGLSIESRRRRLRWAETTARIS